MGQEHSSSSSLMSKGVVSSRKKKLEDEYYVQKVQLGKGSFGVVNRAVHKPTQQDRAVKCVDKRRLESKPNHKQQLVREIEIMRECFGHNNVVKLFDWFEDEKCIYLVLEYCGGGDFGDRILQCRSSLTEKQTCEYMHQILLAVDHLHSKGVCHRDIKPENFLITVSSSSSCVTLKLSDFGLAIRVSDFKKNTLREVAGTPAYQAPEIHNLSSSAAGSPGGDGSNSAAGTGYGLSADIWACGVTLFVILSGGKNPFVNSVTNKLLLSEIRSGSVRFDDLMTFDDSSSNSNTNITSITSRGVKQLFKKPDSIRTKPNQNSNSELLLRLLLTVDPSRRPASAEVLRHPWFVQHGLVSPPPSSPHMSIDSSSLEASPPTMEPVMDSMSRVASFDLNIQEVVEDTVVPRRDSASLTIGPRGSTEGKVVRCGKCGSFFYSQRGQTAACPECRVQLGFALPPDGVNEGLSVYYFSAALKKWNLGKVKQFLDQTGEFLMQDGARVAATSVAPPGKDVGPGNPWPRGTNVVYLSGTYQTWLPAYIENFNEQTRQYDLDVKAGVSADKIRARVKRLTGEGTTRNFPTNY